MKLLAIDIGASGGKAVLGEFQDNRLVTNEVRRFPNRIIDIHGHSHWDILHLFEEVKECIRAAPDAESVGIDTWAVDYGYIDHDGDLMGLPFAYRDARTDLSVPIVHRKIPFEKLYDITGIQHLPFNTIYQIADDLDSRPWIVDNADKLLMIPELLGYLLTGVIASEYTNASTTALLDVESREWSTEILNIVGFPADRLPSPVLQPGMLRAGLTDQVRAETGSKALLNYAACHDTAGAVVGIPATTDNWAYISSGTWSLVGMEIPEPIVTEAARSANFTNEGGADGTIRFLANVTGLWIQDQLLKAWKREGQNFGFDEIRSEAIKAPAFKSLINPDHPLFIAPDDMRTAIRDFCRSTGQTIPKGIGPFMRCVFESLALSYRRRIRQLNQITGREIDRIHVVGGGSREPLLCQMTADACGIPVVAGPTDATATGNLIMQALANGVTGSITYGRRIVANSVKLREYKPSDSGLWENAVGKFNDLMEQN